MDKGHCTVHSDSCELVSASVAAHTNTSLTRTAMLIPVQGKSHPAGAVVGPIIVVAVVHAAIQVSITFIYICMQNGE